MPAAADARAGRAAFTHPAFVLYQTARFLIVVAVEMQAVAVGWQVYEITRKPLDLGLVGLMQFLPGILLFPVSGHASDRFERRNVLSASYAGFAVCFSLLLVLAQRGVHPLPGSIQAEPPEAVVDAAPGWEVVRNQAPRTAAP